MESFLTTTSSSFPSYSPRDRSGLATAAAEWFVLARRCGLVVGAQRSEFPRTASAAGESLVGVELVLALVRGSAALAQSIYTASPLTGDSTSCMPSHNSTLFAAAVSGETTAAATDARLSSAAGGATYASTTPVDVARL